MGELRNGMVLGSTRPGRRGAVAGWLLDQADGRRGGESEIVDLADFHLATVANFIAGILLVNAGHS